MVFFFNDTATTEIYTLSLHDALPISWRCACWRARQARAPRCRTRSAGTRTASGRRTTTTSSRSAPPSWSAAGPNSPGRRRSPAASASRRPEPMATPDASPRPFEGVRILDFTQVLAGPFAAYQLALLGADVVKVERREGEDMRRTPLSREWAERNMAPAFQAVNGNKRSLTLDLQKPEAIAVVKRLAAEADVVMENFRPGVMDRLGIGYEALSALNPRLIFCSV